MYLCITESLCCILEHNIIYQLYSNKKEKKNKKKKETVENSERDGNTRPPDLPLEKSVCRSGSNS